MEKLQLDSIADLVRLAEQSHSISDNGSVTDSTHRPTGHLAIES